MGASGASSSAAHVSVQRDSGTRKERRMEGIGSRLRELRMMAGWEGKEMAARASLSPSALSKIERGTQDLSPAQLHNVVVALTEAPTFARVTRSEIRDILFGERRAYVVTEEAEVEAGETTPELRALHLKRLDKEETPAEAGVSERREGSSTGSSDQMS